MKGRGEHRMTCLVLSPVIKGHAPRVGARVSSKAEEFLVARLKSKPATVLLSDGAIGCFNL